MGVGGGGMLYLPVKHLLKIKESTSKTPVFAKKMGNIGHDVKIDAISSISQTRD